MSQTATAVKSVPHLVFRVHIFGPLVWQVHLLKVAVPKLEPSGMALDVQERAVIPAAPREASAEGIKTDITTCVRRFASCSKPLWSLQTNSTAVSSQTTAAHP